jgi:hypothetical protein
MNKRFEFGGVSSLVSRIPTLKNTHGTTTWLVLVYSWRKPPPPTTRDCENQPCGTPIMFVEYAVEEEAHYHLMEWCLALLEAITT